MASRATALALAVLVVASGCAALPGDQATPTATPTPVEHHEIVFASTIVPYDATVTVERDGETVLEETVSGDATDAYSTVGTLSEPGPYTVTVNTSIELHDGTMSSRFRIDGDVGNATAITADYHGIYPDTFSLPRRNATYPVGAYSNHMNVGGSSDVRLEYRVWYQGELVAENATTVEADELTRVVPVDDTGVYRVSARAAGDWTNETVVLDDPGSYIAITIDAQGGVSTIEVKPAYRWAAQN